MNARPILENPNSCGQGKSPLALEHYLAPVVIAEGYSYSHTTPIGTPSGNWVLHHTFTNTDHHSVSLRSYPETGLCSDYWSTSCSTATGYQHSGKAMVELKKHLKAKRYRYKFSKAA